MSFRNANSWNVILAVTVGRIGISRTNQIHIHIIATLSALTLTLSYHSHLFPLK
jgi:hypothetical protein